MGLRGWALAAIVTAALCGCSGGPPPIDSAAPTPSSESFDAMITQAIASAKEGQASDSQIAILEAAAHAVVQCFNDVGIEASYAEQINMGVLLPGYSANNGALGEETGDALMEECDQREFGWVSSVYQTQPATIALQNAELQQYIPLARQCLEDAGYALRPDANWPEAEAVAIEALSESDGEVNCLGVVFEASLGSS